MVPILTSKNCSRTAFRRHLLTALPWSERHYQASISDQGHLKVSHRDVILVSNILNIMSIWRHILWWGFCSEKNISTFKPTTTEVILFLQHFADNNNWKYGTFNPHTSPVSLICSTAIGPDQILKQFKKNYLAYDHLGQDITPLGALHQFYNLLRGWLLPYSTF